MEVKYDQKGYDSQGQADKAEQANLEKIRKRMGASEMKKNVKELKRLKKDIQDLKETMFLLVGTLNKLCSDYYECGDECGECYNEKQKNLAEIRVINN